MQCMHSRRAFIAPVKALGEYNVRVPLAILRTPAVRRDSAGRQVRGAANLDAPPHNQHSLSQLAMQTETLLQPKSEHVALKALKVAVLVPVLFSVMWTDPAHAARKSRKSAAAQIVELVTAEEPKSPLEQLQAQISSFIHKITDKISHKSHEQAAAADNSFLAQVPIKISKLQRLLPEKLQQLQQPEVRKVLAATVAVLVVALLIRSAQSSSSAKSAAGSGSDGGSSSSTVKVTIPAEAGQPGAAAAPVFATIAGNGTSSNVKVRVTVPVAAATAAPAAATATQQQQQQQKEAAQSTAEAKKLLKTIRDSEDRIKATAAATKQEVKASAAAATAAVEKARKAADQASSSLTARSASPSNPEPPKVVKPNITKSPASTPATSQLAGSSPATSQLAGFSSSSSSRPSSPPPLPNVPDKGAATPALTVIGAGAILFDLMMPLGKLAVASARSAAGLPSNVTDESNTAGSSSSSSSGGSRARTSSASSRPRTPTPKPAPAAPAVPPAPPKPPQQSKLAKALAAAAAAESAVLPRSVPTELPPVTLEELEAALRASGKMT